MKDHVAGSTRLCIPSRQLLLGPRHQVHGHHLCTLQPISGFGFPSCRTWAVVCGKGFSKSFGQTLHPSHACMQALPQLLPLLLLLLFLFSNTQHTLVSRIQHCFNSQCCLSPLVSCKLLQCSKSGSAVCMWGTPCMWGRLMSSLH